MTVKCNRSLSDRQPSDVFVYVKILDNFRNGNLKFLHQGQDIHTCMYMF